MVPKKYGLGSTFGIKRYICDRQMQISRKFLTRWHTLILKPELRMVSGFKGISLFILQVMESTNIWNIQFRRFAFSYIHQYTWYSSVWHWFIGVTLEGQAYDPFWSNEQYRHYLQTYFSLSFFATEDLLQWILEERWELWFFILNLKWKVWNLEEFFLHD